MACSSTFDQPGWSKQPEDAKAASGAKQEADGDLNIQSLGDALGQSLSFFDATMEDAMNSHFLERFSFRQFGFSVTDDGYTEILMRLPRLKPGRPFITLTFALDQDGKIIRSRLNIQRRYIEDKIHGAFARDYAKSFVQAAVSYKSQESVDTIANEIFYRQDLAMIKNIQSKLPSPSASDQKTSPPEELKEGDVIISGAVGKTADVPDLPKHVSEMYRCFTGKEKVSKMKLNDAVLKFSNENLNGEATLVITVEAIGFEHQDDLKNVDFENLPMHVPAI
ncbi:MAG: hypothetical protein SGJ27_14100 [Candidatus Melainabacteria bacterium]|nr:hypothetical protein [Candidatus Melainabacteria bacterium]